MALAQGGGLPQILLNVNPSEVMDGDRRRLGGYLSALTQVLMDLDRRMGRLQEARTPEERKRLRYRAVQYLMHHTRVGLLRRYWNKMLISIGRGDGISEKHEKARTRRLEWLEDEYKKVASAVQYIMELLAKDRQEKTILQDSAERLALAMGETQTQLSTLAKEIAGIMFSANKQDYRRTRGDVLLLAVHNRALVRHRCYEAWRRYVARSKQLRGHKRNVRYLLQGTAKCILRQRLRQWTLYAQRRLTRRIKTRNAVGLLQRKTQQRTLHAFYVRWLAFRYRIARMRKQRAKDLRNQRHLRYLLLKNERAPLFRWYYDQLVENVRRQKDRRFVQLQKDVGVLDAVTRQNSQTLTLLLREMRMVKDRQKRSLARDVQDLRRRNMLACMRPFFEALAARRLRQRVVRLHVRNVRYVMNKAALATLRRFYDKLVECGPHRRRLLRIKTTKCDDLAKRTWKAAVRRGYDAFIHNAAQSKHARRTVSSIKILARTNIVKLIRRYYEKIEAFRSEKASELASKEDLGQVMSVVESLLGEVTRGKNDSMRQQVHTQKLALTHLALQSRRRLAGEYFLLLRLHKDHKKKRSLQRVHALRYLRQVNIAVVRAYYHTLAANAYKNIARRKKMALHEVQVRYLVPRSEQALLQRAFSTWHRKIASTNRGELPVLNRLALRTANRKMAVLVLSAQHHCPLRTCYAKLVQLAAQRRKRHRQHANVAYLLRRTAQQFVRRYYEMLYQKCRSKMPNGLAEATADGIERWAAIELANQRLAGSNRNLNDKVDSLERQLADVEKALQYALERNSEADSFMRSTQANAGFETRFQEEMDNIKRDVSHYVDNSKRGERDMGGTVATLQKQMQNTSSVLNKLIDRVMAVDEFVTSEKARGGHHHHNTLRSVSPPRAKKHSIPAAHLSSSRDRSFAPPGPPAALPSTALIGTFQDDISLCDASEMTSRAFSPPRHRVPSSSAMSKVMASEQLTLLHATGQMQPVSAPREW